MMVKVVILCISLEVGESIVVYFVDLVIFRWFVVGFEFDYYRWELFNCLKLVYFMLILVNVKFVCLFEWGCCLWMFFFFEDFIKFNFILFIGGFGKKLE